MKRARLTKKTDAIIIMISSGQIFRQHTKYHVFLCCDYASVYYFLRKKIMSEVNNTIYVVTGCTGYVGNVLTKKLMDENCRVVGLARSEEKVKRVFKDRAPKIVYGDVRNKEDLEKLFFEEDAEYVVIHTVAYVTIGEGSEKELFEVTVSGTENMAEAALRHNVKKFLHISSSEAIPEGLILDDELSNYDPDPAHAKDGYSTAKSMADMVILDAVKNRGLNASLILIAGVLGPGDFSLSHMTQVIIDFIESRLPASVDGGYNDFDIRDVADVLMNIIEKAAKGESYMFANRPDKINEVLGYVADKCGLKIPVTLPIWTAYVGLPFLYVWSKLIGKRPLYTRAALKSLTDNVDFPIAKSVREFGYSPRPLKETVEDHVDFLINEGMVKL